MSEDPAPQLSINTIGWSDDARFLLVQEGVAGALRVFDLLETPPALVTTIDQFAQERGATRFGSESEPERSELLWGFRSSDYGFEPGGRHIVYAARDVGWVVMDLATAEVASQPVAPLSAELILGFSSERELIWLDPAGVHATSLDPRRERLLLASDAFAADSDVPFGDNEVRHARVSAYESGSTTRVTPARAIRGSRSTHPHVRHRGVVALELHVVVAIDLGSSPALLLEARAE